MEKRDGKQLHPLRVPLEEHLRQNCTRQIIARLAVGYRDVLPLPDSLFQLLKRYVLAGGTIVETPIRVACDLDGVRGHCAAES